MNVGSLEIQMAMDLARMREDLAIVKNSVGDAMSFVNGAVDVAKKVFVGFVSVATIDAFKGMVMGAVNATGALHDMAQQTGNSAAALAQFRSIGAYSETSIESIASASLKLSKNLALTDEEGKGAALAIKALGLDFDTFSKMKPDERMLVAAKALGEYEDGAEKSAAAMLLFGKEGAKLLPFLGDLASQAEEVTGKLSEQEIAAKALQASMADAFGDNLTKIQKSSESWKKDISLGLLPAMYEASEAFLKMTGGAGGLSAKISQLAKDGTLAEWARNAMTAVSYVVDVVQGLGGAFQIVLRTFTAGTAAVVQLLGGLGSAMKLMVEGEYSKALDAAKEGVKGFGSVAGQYVDDVSRIWNQKLIGETFRETMSSLKGVQAETKKTGKELDPLLERWKKMEEARKAEAEASKHAADEQKKLIAAYEAAEKAGEDLRRSIDLKNEQLQEEIDLGRKLTPVELENLKLTRDLASGKVLLSQSDEKATRAAIAHGAALEREVAWMQSSRKENLAVIEATGKRIESLRADTEKQREANAELLLNSQQLAEVRRAKLLDLAASADRKAALMDEIDWTGELGDQQRELAQAYRDSADVVRDGAIAKAAKEAQDAWQRTVDSIGQGLTDSLYRAFEAGKGFLGTFWDGIKNTFKTTVLKLAVQAVMSPVNAALGGLLGASAANAAGASGGAGGGLGMIGTLASAYNAGKALIGGGMGMLTNFSGSVANMATEAGVKLFNAGFEGIGGFLSQNGAVVGNVANALGTGLSYVSAIKSLADGKYGAGVLGGLGTYFGGPIGGMLGNFVGGGLDKLFGGNGTHHAGAGYVSDGSTGRNVSDGSMGLSWSYGDSVGKYFSSDISNALKSLTGGTADMLNDLSKLYGGKGGYQVGAYFASDNDRESQGSRSVLLDGQILSQWGGKGLDKDATKGLQQLADALAGQVRDVIGQINLPDWAKAQIDALGAGVTMEQLAQAVMVIKQTEEAVKGIGAAFAPLGGVFSQIAGLSGEAVVQLAQFAGGIDALMAKAKSFVDNYYTEPEKNAIAAAQVLQALTEAGVADAGALSSKEDFRALAEGIGVQTEEARKQFAALLNLNEAFAPVGAYLKEQGLTLAELAKQAPQTAALQALKDSATTQLEVQQENSDRLVQLDDTFNQVGADLGGKLVELTTAVRAGLAAVAANTGDLSRRFSKWDGGDGVNTVAAP